MSKLWLLLCSVGAALATSVGLAARAVAANTAKPNVLIFVTDDQRWNTLGCYGDPVIRTPNIDSLARGGVLFKYAFVQAPQCCPSRASLQTGRYPHAHHVRWNSIPIPDDETTIGQILSDSGYETACFGKMHVKPQDPARMGFQYSSTISDYNRYLAQHGIKSGMAASKGPYLKLASTGAGTYPFPKEHYITNWIGDRAVEYLKEHRHPHKPFFMYVSFFKPHIPWNPPEPYDKMYDPKEIPLVPRLSHDLEMKPPSVRAYYRHMGMDKISDEELRSMIARHYGLISLVDDNVGKVLKALEAAGVAENTIVVYLSDNGTMLADHNLIRKGRYVYDANARTPLLMRWPAGFPAGKVVDGSLADEIDIMPTLLAAAGVQIPRRVQGMNLIPVIDGTASGKDSSFQQIGFEANGYVTSIRTLKWRYVYYTDGTGELYDHQKDPHETTNLFGKPEYKDVISRLQERLLRWRTETQDRWPYPLPEKQPPKRRPPSPAGKKER